MQNTNQFTATTLRTDPVKVIPMAGVPQAGAAAGVTEASSTHETLYKAATLAAALLLLAGAAAA
jgi:hypothetical protein